MATTSIRTKVRDEIITRLGQHPALVAADLSGASIEDRLALARRLAAGC